jgi:hypothetical protein
LLPTPESPSPQKRTPLPGGANLSEKMKTYALAVHVSKTPKASNFIEFYKAEPSTTHRRLQRIVKCGMDEGNYRLRALKPKSLSFLYGPTN